MNKSDLIDVVSDKAELTRASAGKVIDVLISTIVSAIAKGEKITLTGFGTFKLVKRLERTGRNPKTGAAMKIPAANVPKFSAGLRFKAAVAGRRKPR